MKRNILIGIILGTSSPGGISDFERPSTLPVGGSQPHNILQPYITVYMYKRVS